MSDFFNNFIGKNKNFIDRNKKVFLLLISILVVITVFLNSTYSLLFKEDVTDLQSYTTGVLQLTSNTINNSVTLTNSLPMSDTDGLKSTPYDFKITNTGNLAFKFDVKLLSTDTTNQIDSQYIKISVNGEEAVTLSSLTEGKILENITLDSGLNTKVSLRVWLSEDTPNSQIGKVFNAKIVTEGYAVYTTESVLPNIDYVTPDISDFTYYTMDTDPGYADYMEDNHILLASYNGTHENIKIPNTYTVNGDSYDTLLLVDSDTNPAGDIGVFANNTVIKNVYIEENVKTSYVSGREGTTSGFGLFYGCSNLETVVIENPNIDYSDQMFNTGSSSTVEVYVPENSITYDSLVEWNSNSQLFGDSGGEIITFGDTPVWVEPTPYTDFTYYLSTDTSSETIYLEDFYGGCNSDSCVDISSSITGTVFNNSTNYIVLFDYIGTNVDVIVPGTYTIDGTEYDVYIVSEARLGDGSYNGIFYGNDLIENVDIASETTSLTFSSSSIYKNYADYLFYNCTNLVTVSNLPSSITNMHSTFYGCTSLVNAPVIPDSVTSIIYIFYNCTSLVNAPVIPESVTNMSYTFYNCTSLVNAPVIPNSVTNMTSTFSGCTSLVTAPVIPDSVTYMGSTFYNCTSLVNAPVIPDSVTYMSSTFDGCTSLVNAPVIPDSVTNMSYTFYNCTSLVNAPVIPNSVTNMNKTFYNCSNLTGTVTVNSSNVSSATNAFQYTNSNNLITLNVPTGSTTYTTFSNASLPSNVTLTQFTP